MSDIVSAINSQTSLLKVTRKISVFVYAA